MKALTNIIFLSLCSISLQAQSFSVEISSDTIPIGNYVELVFKIENIEGEFEPPVLQGFEIVSGPNMSSTMQILNGTMTSTKEYSYYIKPMELGQYQIDPAYIITHEKKWATQPAEIYVTPNPDNITILPQQRNRIFFESPLFPSQEMKPKENEKPKKKLKRL